MYGNAFERILYALIYLILFDMMVSTFVSIARDSNNNNNNNIMNNSLLELIVL